MGVEPTKLTAWTRASDSSTSTASLSPLTTFSTPGGRPASCSSSAMNNTADGLRSDGLSTKVLPQTIAMGYIHSGTMAGKLNGVIPATTPSGWNSLQESIAGPAFLLYSPFNSSGAPQAYSTFSIPRCSSPMASWAILPCSSPIRRQISSALRSSNSLKRNMILARLSGGVLRQAGYAASDAATVALTVVLLASATCFDASPVDGLKTSWGRLACVSIVPLIECPIVFTVCPLGL